MAVEISRKRDYYYREEKKRNKNDTEKHSSRTRAKLLITSSVKKAVAWPPRVPNSATTKGIISRGRKKKKKGIK
jgi:hypothetical protein